MIDHLLFALWVFLPAGFANGAPVVVAKIPVLKNWQAPIDGGRTFKGKRLLGANKTWRGLASGIVIAILVLWLQQYAVAHTTWAPTLSGNIDYQALPTLLLGALSAIGVLLGDAIESFFKRQRGVPPGKSWFPFDQIDYILGGIIFTWPLIHWSLTQALWVLLVWTGMHLIVSYIGYKIGYKNAPI